MGAACWMATAWNSSELGLDFRSTAPLDANLETTMPAYYGEYSGAPLRPPQKHPPKPPRNPFKAARPRDR